MNQKECALQLAKSVKKLTEVEKMFFSKPIKISTAYKEYAKKLGKGVKKLTDDEKRQALITAALAYLCSWA